ncbi:MAG TPA: hypothetical protein PKA71_02190 [Saprospiraceae bacterium]|nr:hypothetical protein [Saprospiraceae bacterium]
MISQDAVALNIKGISDVFKNAAANDILRYKDLPIFSMKTGTTLSETFVSREGMSGVKELAEGETPPSLSSAVGASTTILKKTYGGAIEVTREMRLQANDSTVKVSEYVNDLASDLLQANRMKFLNVVYGMLNDGHTGATFLSPDTKALFAVDHAFATGTTFSNKGTSALSLSAWEATEKIGGAFVDGNGVYFPLDFDTIIVKMGSSAATTAKKLFAMNITPSHVADVNIYQGGTKRVVETPGISSDTAWIAYASQYRSPLYIGITNMPYLDEPIKQKNGSVWTNCFGDYKVGINNLPYMLYGSTGTA